MAKNKTEQPKNKKKQDEDEDEEVAEDEDDEEEVEETDDDVEVEEDEEEEEAPKPKKKGAKGEKTGKGSGLVPREPVSVPKAVYKAQKPEVQKLLKERDDLQAKGDKKGLRKVRAALRKAGFRLSNANAASEE